MVSTELENIVIVITGLLIIGVLIFASIVSLSNVSVITSVSSSTQYNENLLLDNGTSSTLSDTPTLINSITSANDTWLDFNGNLTWINITGGDWINITNQNYTISFWVNGTTPSSDEALFTNTPYTTTNGISFRSTTTGGINVKLQNNTFEETKNCVDNSNGGLWNGQWRHVVAQINISQAGQTMDCYLDNVLNNSLGWEKINGGSFDEGLPFTIGFTEGFNNYSNYLDEFRVYNRSLSSAEISQIYNSGRIPNSSLTSIGLQLWQSFNENQGNTAYDKSVLGNNGTIIGNSNYQTDGINLTLVQDTDFTLVSALFTLINDRYSWSKISASYQSGQDVNNGQPVTQNVSQGYVNFSTSIPSIMQILGAVLIISVIVLIIVAVRRINVQEGL